VRQVSRFFVKDDPGKGGQATYETSAFYSILLTTETAFPFLPVLCGRVRHTESLTDAQINTKVYWIRHLRSLYTDQPEWQNLRQQDGWYLATPTDSRLLLAELRGYVLDLFDITGADVVARNLVGPLTTPDPPGHLSDFLTVPAYAFRARANAAVLPV